MTVLAVKGQANAMVVLKGLLQQHGMPDLTPEGVDVLSQKFETGLVIGNGVVSHDGRPLIDVLRALHVNAESKRLFVTQGDDQTEVRPVGNLTDQMRQEITSNRRARALPADWLARRQSAKGITLEHMAERERQWR